MAKILTFGETKIICQALTFGYLYDIETGVIEDTILGAVMNGADILEEDVRKLRRNEVDAVWDAIKKETYPELYDAEGNEIDVDDTDTNPTKKKV